MEKNEEESEGLRSYTQKMLQGVTGLPRPNPALTLHTRCKADPSQNSRRASCSLQVLTCGTNGHAHGTPATLQTSFQHRSLSLSPHDQMGSRGKDIRT